MKNHRTHRNSRIAAKSISLFAALAIILSLLSVSGPVGLKAFAEEEDTTSWSDASVFVSDADIFNDESEPVPDSETSESPDDFGILPEQENDGIEAVPESAEVQPEQALDDGIDDLPDFYVSSSDVRAVYDIFEYAVTDKGAVITSCDKSVAGVITVPAEMNGVPVVAIGNESFKNCVGITGVVLPDSVTGIGHYAFSGCSALSEINITPDMMIGHGTFDGCNDVKTVGEEGEIIVYGGLNRLHDNTDTEEDPDSPNPNGLSITSSQLAQIMAEFRKYPTYINVTRYNISVSDVGKLESALAKKYPYDIYATIDNWGYSYSGSKLYGLYPCFCAKGMNKEKADKRITNLKKAVAPYLEQVKGKDAFACAVLAHNYVILRADYDYSFNYYGAYDILVRRTAVCQGYSEAYDLLMKLKNVPCYIVSSEPMNHAWNMVKVKGYWFHVDNTWDDNGDDTRNTIFYTYFLRNDAEIKKLDHSSWYIFPDTTRTAAPKSTTKYFSSMPRFVGQDLMDNRWYYYDMSKGRIISSNIRGADKKTVRVINGYTCGCVGYQGVLVLSDGESIYAREPVSGKEKCLYTTTSDENYNYIASVDVNTNGKLTYAHSSYAMSVSWDSGEKYYLFSSPQAGTYTTDLDLAKNLVHFKLSSNSAAVMIGQKATLKTTLYPYTTLAAPAWSSSDDTIATVDGNGNITGKSVGVAQITVTAYNLTATARVAVGPVMAAPASISGSITATDSIKLKWAAVENVDGYQVVRSDAKNGKYTGVSLTEELSFAESGLTAGSTYYYKVRPYTLVEGTRVYGPYSAIKQLKPIPLRPSSIAVTSVNYKTLKISWNAVSKVNGYQILRSTSKNGSYSIIATVSKSELLYKDTSVTCGKQYYYKVRGYKVVNSKKIPGYCSAIANQKPLPAKPSVTAAKASSTSIKLTWKKVGGASGYQVYRATSKGGEYKLLKTVKSDTLTYTDKKLKSGKTYYYKVRAYRTVNSKNVYGPSGVTQFDL